MTMTDEEQHAVELALCYSQGLVRGLYRGRLATGDDAPQLVRSLMDLERALGALRHATRFHDAGAVAWCSYCGRYSADARALREERFLCDCGRHHGWTGSFVRPTTDSSWSVGIRDLVGPDVDVDGILAAASEEHGIHG